MKTPSRSPILAAAAALILSTCTPAKPPKAEDGPVPPVPADVRAQGGDAVVDWMLENGYLDPEVLREHTGDKARQAATGDQAVEGADKNSLLAKLHSGFESLPNTAFMDGVKPEWKTVVAKLTPEVLATVNKLENPRIYGVNREGHLLIGDGGNEVPSFTLGQNYSQARKAAQAQGLSLMTEDDYGVLNKGTMEVARTWTWLESGKAPIFASGGSFNRYVRVNRGNPDGSNENGGARRVFRVKF